MLRTIQSTGPHAKMMALTRTTTKTMALTTMTKTMALTTIPMMTLTAMTNPTTTTMLSPPKKTSTNGPGLEMSPRMTSSTADSTSEMNGTTATTFGLDKTAKSTTFGSESTSQREPGSTARSGKPQTWTWSKNHAMPLPMSAMLSSRSLLLTQDSDLLSPALTEKSTSASRQRDGLHASLR